MYIYIFERKIIDEIDRTKKNGRREGKRDEPARKERGKKNTDTIANENIISFDLWS